MEGDEAHEVGQDELMEWNICSIMDVAVCEKEWMKEVKNESER